jgi:hypothetical protein
LVGVVEDCLAADLTPIVAFQGQHFTDGDGDDLTLVSSYTSAEQAVFGAFVAETLVQSGTPFALNSDTKFFQRETSEWRPEQEVVLNAVFDAVAA